MDVCGTSPRLGLDGMVPATRIFGDECCPITPCQLDPCALACNFVKSLPVGPLWDTAKLTALEHLSCGQNVPCDDTECTSIVMHAVYSGHKLHGMIRDILWPAVRESNPFTAYTSLDSWLDLLGWQDCFKCACECIDGDSGETRAPYDLLMPDGRSVCCPSEAPVGLDLAVKRGIVIALWRLSHGIVPNADSINFILSSLGARIDHVYEPNAPASPRRPKFRISAASDTIPCANPNPCPVSPQNNISCDATDCSCHMTAYWQLTCDGNGDNRRIYPGVLAAECIARALIDDRRIIIIR